MTSGTFQRLSTSFGLSQADIENTSKFSLVPRPSVRTEGLGMRLQQVLTCAGCTETSVVPLKPMLC